MKAKYIGVAWTERVKGYQRKVLEYEYRGHKYEVVDYGWQGEPLSWQHKNEQAKIDEIIEKENHKSEFISKNSSVGLELFFKAIGLIDEKGQVQQ
jgi:hypothetical protein